MGRHPTCVQNQSSLLPLPPDTHRCLWMCNMQITQSHLSVATLTNEPLEEQFTVETAPMIKAVVVGKGADFANFAGNTDGSPSMPQVCIEGNTSFRMTNSPHCYLHSSYIYVLASAL